MLLRVPARRSGLGDLGAVGAVDQSLVKSMLDSATYQVGSNPTESRRTLDRAWPLLQQLSQENPGAYGPLLQQYNHVQTLLANYANKPGAQAASQAAWSGATTAATTYNEYSDVRRPINDDLWEAWEITKGQATKAKEAAENAVKAIGDAGKKTIECVSDPVTCFWKNTTTGQKVALGLAGTVLVGVPTLFYLGPLIRAVGNAAENATKSNRNRRTS